VPKACSFGSRPASRNTRSHAAGIVRRDIKPANVSVTAREDEHTVFLKTISCLSSKDLDAIQKRALAEGLPYQTLISSLLHKYASGRLKEV
jgi:ribosomal protein L28